MGRVNRQKNKGFTLIELMVATSLFIVIMLSAMGSLFMLLDESKNSRALRVAMENVNFAMDSMTRSIRMGTDYYCNGASTSCINGSELSFVPQSQSSDTPSSRITYEFDSTNYTIKRSNGDSIGVPIISPEVKIDLLNFNIKVPSSSQSLIQPSVYITIKGRVMVKGVPTSFALQTLASQRNF